MTPNQAKQYFFTRICIQILKAQAGRGKWPGQNPQSVNIIIKIEERSTQKGQDNLMTLADVIINMEKNGKIEKKAVEIENLDSKIMDQ